MDPKLDLLASQCEFEFYRASGPGGQHRNKVESAVRVLHLPTGVKAQASERRSQFQNREEALRRLAAKLEARSRRRIPRVPTKKSRSVRERELDTKKRVSDKKRERGRLGDD